MISKETSNSTILRATVGSHLFGLNIEGSDVDEMGVCLEPIERVVGFKQFEQDESKDPDIVIYGLRKYLSLALKGNPTILTLLYAPESMCSVRTFIGAELQALAPKIISRQAGKAFLGYLQAQRKRLAGEQGGKDVNRPELVEKYGYDTKYAMHMLRLGYQGIELLTDGKLTLPMTTYRKLLMDVRYGKLSLKLCMHEAEAQEEILKKLLVSSKLPEQPDYEQVEKWMIDTYFNQWKS